MTAATGVTAVVLPSALASASGTGGQDGLGLSGWTLTNFAVSWIGGGTTEFVVDVEWDGTGVASSWFVRFYRADSLTEPIAQSPVQSWTVWATDTVIELAAMFPDNVEYLARLYLTGDTSVGEDAYYVHQSFTPNIG